VKIFCSLLVCVLVLSTATPAQSPYRLSWEKDGIILGSGAAVSILGYSLEQKINPLSVQEIEALSRNNINAFDRSATYHWSKNLMTGSDAGVVLMMLSPLSLFLDNNVRKDFQTISAMYFETMLFAVFLPSIAKRATERVRPFIYNEQTPLQDKLDVEARKSFFSGHTTVAFASAVFLSTVYDGYFPDSKYKNYVWAGSLLTASIMGYLRYASGAHFPTDILAGAVAGSAVGCLIPYLHKTNDRRSELFPTLNQSNGFTIHYLFQF